MEAGSASPLLTGGLESRSREDRLPKHNAPIDSTAVVGKRGAWFLAITVLRIHEPFLAQRGFIAKNGVGGAGALPLYAVGPILRVADDTLGAAGKWRVVRRQCEPVGEGSC
jgi:hypothetical protein